MCQDCGCDQRTADAGFINAKMPKEIGLNIALTQTNGILALQNKNFLQKKQCYMINLMGAPGAGKTAIIEQLAAHLSPEKMVVIQGDLSSDIDKDRLVKQNIQTHQINTHSGCHLTAAMINTALLEMSIKDKKYLIIENVGNLVCPAGVDLGQHINLLASATTEGSDKPLKYPPLFRDAGIILITKYDIKDAVNFDEDSYISGVTKINPKAKVIQTSNKDKGSFTQLAKIIAHKRDHAFSLVHKH